MSNSAINALHDIHTATNDVLEGYRELSARAEPEIRQVISRLLEMHQRHAAEQAAELVRLRDPAQDDSSLQGTVNKVVVILRDWLSNLDRDALPAVREGEDSLLKEYHKALLAAEAGGSSAVTALLTTQVNSIEREISKFPRA